MSRGPATFRLRDVTRALKAARAAGVEVARFEIDRDGKIVVIAGKPGNGDSERNEWDEELYGAHQTEAR